MSHNWITKKHCTNAGHLWFTYTKNKSWPRIEPRETLLFIRFHDDGSWPSTLHKYVSINYSWIHLHTISSITTMRNVYQSSMWCLIKSVAKIQIYMNRRQVMCCMYLKKIYQMWYILLGIILYIINAFYPNVY